MISVPAGGRGRRERWELSDFVIDTATVPNERNRTDKRIEAWKEREGIGDKEREGMSVCRQNHSRKFLIIVSTISRLYSPH